MNCPNCNLQIEDTEKKCNHCGVDIETFMNERDRVQSLLNTTKVTKKESSVGELIKVIGALTVILGLIAACIIASQGFDFNFGLFFVCVVAFFICGTFIYGFGEILQLLTNIDQKLDRR